MDAKEITERLGRLLFEKGHSPIAGNFIGEGLHECDIISVSGTKLLYEYEIKVSVSDFKADFKKTDKHKWLASKNGIHKTKDRTYFRTCSYFYYVCPACLIREDMIPAYAGLIWVHHDGRIDYKVKAPRLHDTKATEQILHKIGHNLTQKFLFGKAYLTLLNHEFKKDQKDKLEGKKTYAVETPIPIKEETPKPKPKGRVLIKKDSGVRKKGKKK